MIADPQFQLLLSATSAQAQEVRLRSMATSLENGVEWSQYLSLASRHRIEGLAFRDLASSEQLNVAQSIRDEMTKRRRVVATTTLEAAATTAQLTTKLTKHGIDCAVLKGAPQAMEIFGNLSSRSSVDIDLLIDPGNRQAAHRAMLDLGYTTADLPHENSARRIDGVAAIMKDLTYVHPKSRYPVELHWRLNKNPWLLDCPPLDSPAWKTMDLAGAEITVPDRSLLMKYLLAHGATTRWSRLKWLADLHHLTAMLTSEELADHARECVQAGLEGPWVQASTMLETLYGETARLPTVPPVKPKRRQLLVDIAMEQLQMGEKPIIESELDRISTFFKLKRYQLNVKHGLRHSLFELFTSLFGDRDVYTLALPRPLVPLYPLLAPITFLARMLARKRTQTQPRNQ